MIRLVSMPDVRSEKTEGTLDPKGVTAEQILAVSQFVRRVGGMEQAKLAVEMLGDRKKAA